MDDKLTIRLIIAGRPYPLNIRREDEELIRKAAKLVNNNLANYMTRFKDNELSTEDLLAMTAIHFANSYLKISETKGDETVANVIQEMNNELDNYLK